MNADRVLAAQMLEQLQHLSTTMTSWAERWGGQIINHVLEVGTYTIPAAGYLERQWHVAAGCVVIRNLGTHTMTVTTGGSASGTVPVGNSTGMWVIPAGAVDVVNIASRQVAIFGTAADQFSLQALTVGGVPTLGGGFGA